MLEESHTIGNETSSDGTESKGLSEETHYEVSRLVCIKVNRRKAKRRKECGVFSE